MRVLHVIPSVSPLHGGPTAALQIMKSALSKAGLEVVVLATTDEVRGMRRVFSNEVVSPDGSTILFGRLNEFYKVAPRLPLWLWKNVEKYQVVHIHALFSFSSTCAAIVSRRKGVPYIIRPLGTLNSYGLEFRRPSLKRWSMRLVESSVLRDAAAVHFTSVVEQQEAERLGLPFKSVVIPLSVDFQPSSVTSGTGSRSKQVLNVLYLSRIDPVKNIEGLISAIGIVRARGLFLDLTIAGGGSEEYVDELRRMADVMGLGDAIRWRGHVDTEQKRVLFESADVFVLPSFSENFGMAAAEALSAGLPCILSEKVAIAKLASDAGAALVVTTAPESIADALECLARQPSTRASLKFRSRAFAENEFSERAMTQRLVSLYRSAIESNATT